MSNHSARIAGLAFAGLALASGAAGAQGKGHGKGRGNEKAAHESQDVRADRDDRDDRDERGDRDVRHARRDRDDRDDRDERGVNRGRDVYDVNGNRVYGNGAKVPPGLAKKPGQMPPGQYKKRYGTNEGADVLGGILRRRGYSVLRVVPAGQSQYVFYRTPDGLERRAIVSPGADRLTFTNVPSALLREVLAALY